MNSRLLRKDRGKKMLPNNNDLIRRVANRFQKTAMAVVLRDVAHHNWGWFSNEDQRMHIQTVDSDARNGPSRIKVWLETKGQRGFNLGEGTLPGADIRKLKSKVDAERGTIEAKWIHFMIQNDWISAVLKGSTITVTAYPKSHNKFHREIDLRLRYPGAYKGPGSWDDLPPQVTFDRENGLLVVGREKNVDDRSHIDLGEFLFVN